MIGIKHLDKDFILKYFITVKTPICYLGYYLQIRITEKLTTTSSVSINKINGSVTFKPNLASSLSQYKVYQKHFGSNKLRLNLNLIRGGTSLDYSLCRKPRNGVRLCRACWRRSAGRVEPRQSARDARPPRTSHVRTHPTQLIVLTSTRVHSRANSAQCPSVLNYLTEPSECSEPTSEHYYISSVHTLLVSFNKIRFAVCLDANGGMFSVR